MGKIKKKEKHSRLAYFLRNFSKKHRVSIRDQYTDTEVSYIYISTMRMVFAMLGVIIVLFAGVAALIIYTPILDKMPGTPGKESREMLVSNIMRLDSLQNELVTLIQYGENVALVMEGKTPEVRTMNRSQEGVGGNREAVAPSRADSILRMQMSATDGRYALVEDAILPITSGARRMRFMPPVRGEVTSPFNPIAGMYGVGITPGGPQQIVAAADGTVVLSTWTPDDDYVIQIQHKDNYVTIYKRATQLLKSVGDRVDAGEVIGYVDTERMASSEWLGNEFVFEIWNDGRPVDPQRYIFF